MPGVSQGEKKQMWNQQFGVGELNVILFNHGTEGKSCPFSGSIVTWYIVYYFRIFQKNKNGDIKHGYIGPHSNYLNQKLMSFELVIKVEIIMRNMF